MDSEKTIRFAWLDRGKKHEKLVEREKLELYFKTCKARSKEEADMCMKLARKIIPYSIGIYLNKDFNRLYAEVPSIYYRMEDERKDKTLEISSEFKKVWNILNKCVTD